MIQITEHYHLAAPPEALFALISDPTRDPDWQPMVKEVRLDLDAPAAGPVTYAIAFNFMGRRMNFRAAVGRSESPRHYAYHSTEGPFAYRGEYDLYLVVGPGGAESTDVFMTLEIEPAGFFGIIPEAVLVQVFRKQLQRSIELQRAIVESSLVPA